MNTLLKELKLTTTYQHKTAFDEKTCIEMLFNMGLHQQVDLQPTVKNQRLTLARQQFRELSTYEIYLYKNIFADNTQNITDYAKERMPDDAIKNLYFGQQNNIFEQVELWQPVQKRPDPMLVGIIDPFAFVLGLWGEPKIDIEAMEKTILGEMYEFKDRIKSIIDRLPVQSLKNTLEMYVPRHWHMDNSWHCTTRDANLNKRINFSERVTNHRNLTINYIRLQELAMCPICNKIVDTAPTVVE